ncbi:MAG: cytochrome c3 family protein [Planctomycetaceae bacterium]|nr:cytochrome c3 family protein [Planctomycetaceae bacterium]
MSPFTSFFTENAPIPDPPHLRYLGWFISVILMIICLLITVFIVFEFSMDMLGSPIQLKDQYHVQFDSDQKEEAKGMSLDEIMSRFSLLSPLPDSYIRGEEVTILCTWDTSGNTIRSIPFSNMMLKVDDLPVSWDVQFGKNTWLVRLKLRPGFHKIQTSCFESIFFVEGIKHQPPEDWKLFTMHEGIGDPNCCQDCHYLVDFSDDIVRRGHALAIGSLRGNESCLGCHQNESFTQKHLSIAAPETDCTSCHRVHGLIDSEKLLKYPKKEFLENF